MLILPLLVGACTSIPLLPMKGTGARWNLATVDHVEASERELERRIHDEFEDSVQQTVDRAMAADRERIAAFAKQTAALEASVEKVRADFEAIRTQITRAAKERVELGSALTQSLDDLNRLSKELDGISSDLDERVAALPEQTLEEFDRALEQYLRGRPHTPARHARRAGGEAPSRETASH